MGNEARSGDHPEQVLIFSNHGQDRLESTTSIEELGVYRGSNRLVHIVIADALQKSQRIFAAHAADATKPTGVRVEQLKEEEQEFGLTKLQTYCDFAEKVKQTKRLLLNFLIEAKQAGKTIVGYGAPAKGNTLLNYCGIGPDFIDYTVDRSPHKQGRYLPGSRIPILAPDRIRETKPDYLFLGPWNLAEEIMQQTAFIREWGGRWIIPIPEVTVKE